MDGTQVVPSTLVVPRRHSPEVLQLVDTPLHDVTPLVRLRIKRWESTTLRTSPQTNLLRILTLRAHALDAPPPKQQPVLPRSVRSIKPQALRSFTWPPQPLTRLQRKVFVLTTTPSSTVRSGCCAWRHLPLQRQQELHRHALLLLGKMLAPGCTLSNACNNYLSRQRHEIDCDTPYIDSTLIRGHHDSTNVLALKRRTVEAVARYRGVRGNPGGPDERAAE